MGLAVPYEEVNMSYENLTHSKWDCKYHVVFVPKCRKKVLSGKIRKFLGPARIKCQARIKHRIKCQVLPFARAGAEKQKTRPETEFDTEVFGRTLTVRDDRFANHSRPSETIT